jgi:Cu/Ag efflux pump CusA
MKFRVLVVGAAVLVLGLGVTQVRNASVDVLPEFAPPQVEIRPRHRDCPRPRSNS